MHLVRLSLQPQRRSCHLLSLHFSCGHHMVDHWSSKLVIFVPISYMFLKRAVYRARVTPTGLQPVFGTVRLHRTERVTMVVFLVYSTYVYYVLNRELETTSNAWISPSFGAKVFQETDSWTPGAACAAELSLLLCPLGVNCFTETENH
jgi:hypothetical protein